MSASFAVGVARGSTTMRRGGFGPRLRSRMRDHRDSLREGDVVPDVEDGIGQVEVRVRAGVTVGAERLDQGVRGGGGAEARVAVHVWRADPAVAHDGEGVVLFEEELAGVVEADGSAGVLFLDLFDCAATTRPIASSQEAGCMSPSRLMSGVVKRSALLLDSQPCRPFGPSRPLFTRSTARPRTPTILPSLTPISSAHPLEQSTQADCTQ